MSTISRNRATIEITTKNSWASEDKETNSDKKSKASFSGSALRGRSRTVGQLKITADDNYYFLDRPKLSTKSKNNFYLKLVSVEKTSNTNYEGFLPIVYNYDLLIKYAGKRSGEKPSVNLKYRTKRIPNFSVSGTALSNRSISNITFGKSIIAEGGEKREISIFGTRGAVFGIAVNESNEQLESTSVFAAADVTNTHIDKAQDVSILINPNNTTIHNYGKKMPIFTGTIGKSGVVRFYQSFPGLTVKSTTVVDGGSKAKHEFSDLTGVRVGDRLFVNGATNTTVILVQTLNPDGDNVNECTLDTSTALTDKGSVSFKRMKRCYSIDLIADLTSPLSSSLIGDDPAYNEITYKLYQYSNISVTIRHKIAGVNYRVLSNNGIATSLGAGAEHDIVYTGEAGFSPSVVHTKGGKDMTAIKDMNGRLIGGRVSIVLDLEDNAHTFSAVVRPNLQVHGNTLSTNVSNWTNTIIKDNGGTAVNISRIYWSKATGSNVLGENDITLNYDFKILRFGTTDVVMELDLDAITTIAT